MATYQIPVTNDPNQTFEVILPYNDTNIAMGLFLRYNRIAQYWQMDVATADEQVIIAGLPCLTGLDLLKQFQHLGLGSLFVHPIQSSQGAPDSPNDSGWGTTHILEWTDGL